MLLFGVLKKNDIECDEIWSPGSVHHSHFARATMSRNRFKLLCQNITFDDIDDREVRYFSNPKFFKFNHVFDRFNENIFNCYEPGKDLCIDETLYPYRGRCQMRQYMPNKPNKYGLKYFNNVDVDTSYLLKSIFYCGKLDKNSKNGTSIGQKIVLSLSENYFNSFRHLAMDNYFTSIPLAKLMFENHLTITGKILSYFFILNLY